MNSTLIVFNVKPAVRWNHLFFFPIITRGNVTCDRERETGTYVGISVSDTQTHRHTEIKTRTSALGLWEGLSHSALLRLMVIVLKSHSASHHLIVIV